MINTNKKSFFTILLCAIMVICSIPVSSNAITEDWNLDEITSGNYTYVVTEDGCSITKYKGKESVIEIPKVLDGCKVTGLASGAFLGNDEAESIIIPESVEEIGAWAFINCKNLASISVAEDNEKFCSQDGVMFNKDMTVLVKYPAAKQCEAYEVPNSVVTIAETAFCGASGITTVILPPTLKEIERYAFYQSSTESIIIPDSVETIG
ncbi:MAG: leucine-rich repeat domain-containing protein, partial [Clostridia bacterium]|nr:leucine-rich repeat domain-containing protein [Clostridia bacterium]